MNRSKQIIRTSWIGIVANVLLAGFKAGITEGTICYPAGYLNLTKEDVTEILKECM